MAYTENSTSKKTEGQNLDYLKFFGGAFMQQQKPRKTSAELSFHIAQKENLAFIII